MGVSILRASLCFVMSCTVCALWAATPSLKTGQNVVFIGDEITAPIADLLKKEYADDFKTKRSRFTVIKQKKGRWADLSKSFARCLKKAKIDEGGRVIVALGMHDACDIKKGTGPNTEEATLIAAMSDVVETCAERKLLLIVCTPSVISSKIQGANVHIDVVADCIREQAKKHNLACADLRAVVAKHTHTDGLLKKGAVLNDMGKALLATSLEPYLGVAAGMIERELREDDRVRVITTRGGWARMAEDLQDLGRAELGERFSSTPFQFHLDSLSSRNGLLRQDKELILLVNQKATVMFLICGGHIIPSRNGPPGKKFIEESYEDLLLKAVDVVKPNAEFFFLVTCPPLGVNEQSEDWAFAQRLSDTVRSVAKKKRVSLLDGHKICLDWMSANGKQAVISKVGKNMQLNKLGKSILFPAFQGILGLGTGKKRKTEKETEQAQEKAASETNDTAEDKVVKDAEKETVPDVGIDDLDLDNIDDM